MTDPLVFRGPEGSITVTAAALTRLVVDAAQSVDGVRPRRPRRAVEVSHGDGRATISLELAVDYGVAVPQAARAVQERVASAVAASSGLEVERVDVAIEEIA